MSRVAFGLLLSILIGACDDDGAATLDAPLADAPLADAPLADAAAIDATLAQQCAELRARWNALVVPLGRSCDAPADCAVVGERSVRSCESYPQLPGNGDGELAGDCNGAAVSAAALAPNHDEVRALEQSFAQLCGQDRGLCGAQGISCVVDCAPGAELTCNDHQCGLTRPMGCLLPPPDAGP